MSAEAMKRDLDRKERAENIQRWFGDRKPILPPNLKRMYAEITKIIFHAYQDGFLKTPAADINRLVQISNEIPKGAPRGACCILGGLVQGPKNFNREQLKNSDGKPLYFERNDGAWFDFSFVVEENKKEDQLNLLGYNLEIRFDSSGERWFRLDLNLPDHHNETRALRAHCHPTGYRKDANRSWAIAYPVLSHIELLDLALCGFREEEG